MCNPVLFGVVSSIAAGAGFVSQREQAKAQQAALDQARQAQAEEIAAKRDMTLGRRVAAARREAAARLASASAAGVGGQSVALDLLNTLGRANQDASVIAKQAAFEDRASAVTYASALARVDKPTIIDGALAVVGGFNRGHEFGKRFSIKGRTRPSAS